MKRFVPCAAMSALLVGCATNGDYPSLAKRSFEKAAIAEAVAPAPSAAIVSQPEVLARVSASLAQARASVSAFDEQLAKSRPQVNAASGAAEGSERWIEGQLAASRLEPLIAAAANAAAAIGDEYRALMLQQASPDRAAVEAALAEATAIADGQARVSGALTASLNR